MVHKPNPDSHLNKVLLEHTTPLVYTLFMAASMLQCQSGVVTTEIVWPAKLGTFIV